MRPRARPNAASRIASRWSRQRGGCGAIRLGNVSQGDRFDLDPNLCSFLFHLPRSYPSLEPGQILVRKLHRDRTLAHRRGHALDRAVAHIAGHKNPRHAGLQQERLARLLPSGSLPSKRKSGPASTNPFSSRKMLGGSHSRARRRADKHKQRTRRRPILPWAPSSAAPSSRSSPRPPAPASRLQHNIGCALDLIDQVFRHGGR
jgi:hypothetical protein